MQKSFSVLGSCVSRDIFRFNNELILNEYFARTTLQSLFGEKYNVDMDDIIIKSQFQKKIIYRDLTSEFLSKDFKENEYVILDFIDERFNIITKDNKVIGTASNEYAASNLPNIIKETKNKKNEIKDWEIAFDKLVIHFRKKDMLNRVILHECYYKNNYMDKEGNIKEFRNGLQEIKKYNKLLSDMYKYAKKTFSNIKVIKAESNTYKASENHMWGLAPIHYTDKYYIEIARKLL